MFHLLEKVVESGILFPCISTVWEDTDDGENQYLCDLDIYLMAVLSSSYLIIIYCAINETDNGKDVDDSFNATDKFYLKEQMKLIFKLASNDTSNISMITSASKDVSIECSDECIKNA